MRTLEILIDGKSSVIHEGGSAVIGRGEEADVKLTDPRVSRLHASVTDRSGTWMFEDRSSGGSWQNGQRVTSLDIASEVLITLGSEGAPEVILRPTGVLPDPNATVAVQAGEAAAIPRAPASQPPRVVAPPRAPLGATPPPFIPGPAPKSGGSNRTVLLVVCGLLVLLAGAFGAAVIARDDDQTATVTSTTPTLPSFQEPPELTPAEQLTVAKLATVQILAISDVGLATGSGAFVSEDLILTNRHVVEGASDLEIATTVTEDSPVELRYAGRVEATHPFLDLALVRLTGASQLSDLTLGELGEPTVLSIGDSSSLRVGDTVRALGFPSIAGGLSRDDMGEVALPVTTVSSGEVITFRPWPGCTNPDTELLLVPGGFSNCSPDGDLPRGNVISDDLSGSGGSGGPVIVDGQIVAVRYAVGPADDPLVGGSVSTGGVALSMPSEYFAEWVTEVVNG